MKFIWKKESFGKISRYLIWFVAICTIILVIFLIVLQFNKENIRQTILSKVNEIQSGELLVTDLEFSLFFSFPNLRIILRDALYYENKSARHSENNQPLCQLERLYLGISLADLLSGRIRISGIKLENGLLNTILYADSSFNLLNALASTVSDTDTAMVNDKYLDLEISEVSLENIKFKFINQISGNQVDLRINKFYNALTLNNDILSLNFNPEIDIIGLNRNGLDFLSGTSLTIAADLTMDMETLTGTLAESRLSIAGANLTLMGNFDLKDDIYLNLQVTSNLDDPSLLVPIFKDEIIRHNLSNIRQGNSFVNGRIEGKILNHIPFIDVSFGISDVSLMIPELDFSLKEIQLQGIFTTGEKQDLSDALFQIRDMSYLGRAGKVQGSVQIENFIDPVISLKIDGTVEATGAEKVFKFIQTPLYSGVVTLKTDIRLRLDPQQGRLQSQSGKTALSIRNLSFLIANTGERCDNLNGDFLLENDTLKVDSLHVNAGNSDLLLNAECHHLINYMLGYDTALDLYIKFKSNAFDFKQFLTGADVGQWILDEYLHPVSGEIFFASDSKNLRQDSELPPGKVTIRNLTLDLKHVEDIAIHSGTIQIEPDRLIIQNFKADIGKNELTFSGQIDNYDDLFANHYLDESRISLDLQAEDIILKDLFTYKKEVYLPDYWVKSQYRNFDLQATMVLPAEADTSRQPPFNLYFDVKRLSAQNKKTGLIIENLRTQVTDTGVDLIFAQISGKIGQSTFSRSSLKLINIFNPDSTTGFNSRLTCDTLNIDQWQASLFYEDSSQISDPETDPVTALNTPDVFSLPVIDLEAEIEFLQYKENQIHNLNLSLLKPKLTPLFVDQSNNDWWLPDFDLMVTMISDTFNTDYFKVPNTNLTINAVNGLVKFSSESTGLFGSKGRALVEMDVAERTHSYRVKSEIENFLIEVFLERLGQKNFLSGRASLHMDIVLLEDDLKKLDGALTVSAENLYVHGLDVDEFLTKYKRTQNFNLVDVGAFMLAGPAGTVVTKATDYANLLQLDSTAKSRINRFLSSWSVQAGRILASDVAFSTDKSRIAMKGGVDLTRSEFVDFMIAVVDKNGCPLLSQGITGHFDQPQLTAVNVVGTILAPVTNVFKLIAGTDCTPFYRGVLAHPGN